MAREWCGWILRPWRRATGRIWGCSSCWAPGNRDDPRPAVPRWRGLRVHGDGRHRRRDGRKRPASLPAVGIPGDADDEDSVGGGLRGGERELLAVRDDGRSALPG